MFHPDSAYSRSRAALVGDWMIGAFEIQDARASDREAIADVMRRNQPDTEARWQARFDWQFLENPLADGWMGAVAVADGRVVGYHLVVPQPLRIGGASVRSWWAMDLFVEPAWRNSMIGLALYRAVLSRAKREPVLSNTANEASSAIWARLKGILVPGGEESLYRVLAPTRVSLLAIERRLLGVTRGDLQIAASGTILDRPLAGGVLTSTALDASWDAMAKTWEQHRDSFLLSTDRTSAYLRWRFSGASPASAIIGIRSEHGELVGYYVMVVRQLGSWVKGRTAWVSDLVVDPRDSAMCQLVVGDIVERARDLRASLLEIRGLDPRLRRVFRGQRFRSRQLPSSAIVARIPDQLIEGTGVACWHVVAADGDSTYW